MSAQEERNIRAQTACPCGCGLDNPDPALVALLVRIEKNLGYSLKYNSICRCEKHNRAVGGSSTSSHLKGLAADIASPKSLSIAGALFALVLSALSVGFNRVGVGKTYIHVDCDKSKLPRSLWTY